MGNGCLSVAASRLHYLIKKKMVILHPHDWLSSKYTFLVGLGQTGRGQNVLSLCKQGWGMFTNAAALFFSREYLCVSYSTVWLLNLLTLTSLKCKHLCTRLCGMEKLGVGAGACIWIFLRHRI